MSSTARTAPRSQATSRLPGRRVGGRAAALATAALLWAGAAAVAQDTPIDRAPPPSGIVYTCEVTLSYRGPASVHEHYEVTGAPAARLREAAIDHR